MGHRRLHRPQPDLADALTAQDGLYTLITRAAEGDRFEVVSSLSPGPRRRRPRRLAGLPRRRRTSRVVTLTVTEAGYLRGARRRPGPRPPRDPPRRRGAARRPRRAVRTAPPGCSPAAPPAAAPTRARSPSSPCDNLPEQRRGRWRRVVADLARAGRPGPRRRGWTESVSFVTTMVDRITPRPRPTTAQAVRRGTGRDDRCPVVTEPFSEWVLCGEFPGGRPAWEAAGATFIDDIDALRAPQALAAQRRPLAAGLRRLAPAGTRPSPRRWPTTPAGTGSQQWWDEASRHLDLPAAEVAGLPRRAARAVRQPADAPPARPDRRRRFPEAAGPHPARAARGAGRRPAARGRGPGAGRLGVPPARRRRARRRRPRRRRWPRSPAARCADAVRHVLDALDPASATDDELVEDRARRRQAACRRTGRTEAGLTGEGTDVRGLRRRSRRSAGRTARRRIGPRTVGTDRDPVRVVRLRCRRTSVARSRRALGVPFHEQAFSSEQLEESARRREKEGLLTRMFDAMGDRLVRRSGRRRRRQRPAGPLRPRRAEHRPGRAVGPRPAASSWAATGRSSWPTGPVRCT